MDMLQAENVRSARCSRVALSKLLAARKANFLSLLVLAKTIRHPYISKWIHKQKVGEVNFRLVSLSREENYAPGFVSPSKIGVRPHTDRRHPPIECSMPILNVYASKQAPNESWLTTLLPYVLTLFFLCFCFIINQGGENGGSAVRLNLEFFFLFFSSGICRSVRLRVRWKWFQSAKLFTHGLTRNCCSPSAKMCLSYVQDRQ